MYFSFASNLPPALTMKSQYLPGASANVHHSRALYSVYRMKGAKVTFNCAADTVNFLLQVVKTDFSSFETA